MNLPFIEVYAAELVVAASLAVNRSVVRLADVLYGLLERCLRRVELLQLLVRCPQVRVTSVKVRVPFEDVFLSAVAKTGQSQLVELNGLLVVFHNQQY